MSSINLLITVAFVIFIQLSVVPIEGATVSSRDKRNIQYADENWYICSNCCKTRKAEKSPWEKGCRNASSGMHQFTYCVKAGDYNFTCRNCDAEIYAAKSTSPGASRCCATGGTHSWYHK